MLAKSEISGPIKGIKMMKITIVTKFFLFGVFARINKAAITSAKCVMKAAAQKMSVTSGTRGFIANPYLSATRCS